MLRTAVVTGKVMTPRHGVYLAGSAWPDDPVAQHLMLARAEQVANPESVISHQSAALAWALPNPTTTRWTELPVSVMFPADGHSSRRGRAIHHHGQLAPSQVVQDERGYPVTTPGRTAVDLATGLELPYALVLLDGAARRECERFVVNPRRRDFANAKLAEAARARLLVAAATVGTTRLNQAIELTNPLRESPAESLSAGHFVLAGLPAPIYQAEIRTRLGVFYPDFYWPEFDIIGECDGAEKYSRPNSAVDEKRREQALRDAVRGMVRWLASEIMFQPWIVLERVARQLGVSYRV